MGTSIISYDIEGSSYTGFLNYTSGAGGDYRKERAVRKFLVETTEEDKGAIIEGVRAAIDDASGENLNTTTVVGNGFLPMQSITVTRAGTATNGTSALWIAEVRYSYV